MKKGPWDQIIVGIGGPSGEGKSTVAKRLIDRWGFHGRNVSDFIAYEWRERKGTEPTKRDMQIYGSERRDIMGADYWMNQVRAWAQVFPRVVLAGCRFPQEIDWVMSAAHPLLIEVTSDTYKDKHNDRDPSWETETALDEFDDWHVHIANNDPLPDLHRKIDDVMQEWALGRISIMKEAS